MNAAPPRPAAAAGKGVAAGGGPPGGECRRNLGLPAAPWVIAHRGASGELLENSLAAVRLAVDQGTAMCEVDVQLTRDGELVVFHDWDLRRLAGDPRVIEESTADELVGTELSLPAPAPPGPALPGPAEAATSGVGEVRRGSLPALRELLAALPPGYPLDLELKRRRADRARLAAALAATVSGRANLLVSSFDHDLLTAVAAALPGVALVPLDGQDPGRLLAAGERLGAWGLGCHLRLATAELLVAAAASRRPVLVYTVNDAPLAHRLLAAGASGVFSDWPARLRGELEALGQRERPG